MATSPLFILYGSATGNAEHIAKDLAATYRSLLGNPDADTFFADVVCCELDQYKKKCQAIWDVETTVGGGSSMQSKHGVLIVASTTGNGDAPENASRFVRYAKRKTTVETQPFRNCAYAVLGLGDTNYDQFCNTGKVLDKKMAELGGTRVTPLVCADEATGLEDAVDPWIAAILSKITQACRTGQEAGPSPSPPVTLLPTSENLVESPVTVVEDEKKMEAMEIMSAAKIANHRHEPKTSKESDGVAILRALIEQQKDSRIDLTKTAPRNSLPSLHAPRFFAVDLVSETSPGQNKSVDENDRVVDEDEEEDVLYTYDRPYAAPVKAARYLTNTSITPFASDNLSLSQRTASLRKQFPLQGEAAARNEKRVIEITLDLPQEGFSYEPGDAIGMVVENDIDDANFVLEVLQQNHGLTPNQRVVIDQDEVVSVEQAIRKCVDLSWVPLQRSKKVLFGLSQLAEGPEKEALEWLSSSMGDSIFGKFIDEQRRTMVDLLKEFPTLQKISIKDLLGVLPGLTPRYYSVTSSPKVVGRSLSIALAVVDYLTPSLKVNGEECGLRRVGGLASQYLESLVSPMVLSATKSVTRLVTVPIFPKPSGDFHLPDSLDKPLVLIGPGTGVAPFIGFIQERRARAMEEGKTAGQIDLYFGCRHQEHDFLYHKELEELQRSGALSRLHTAFSRDGPSKVYVQDVMATHSDTIRDLVLRQDAIVYICGDGNHMAKSVQEEIVSILKEEVDGEAFMAEMKKTHRLLLDIWS